MNLDALAGGGVVAAVAAVSLGAFKLVRFVVARQNNKKASAPPALVAPVRDCGPCNEQLKEMAMAQYALGESLKENTSAIKENTGETREMVVTLRVWIAEEKGRRDATRSTGQFPVQE